MSIQEYVDYRRSNKMFCSVSSVRERIKKGWIEFRERKVDPVQADANYDMGKYQARAGNNRRQGKYFEKSENPDSADQSGFPEVSQSQAKGKYYDAEKVFSKYLQLMKTLVTKEKIQENTRKLEKILSDCLNPVAENICHDLAKESDPSSCQEIIKDEINMALRLISGHLTKSTKTDKYKVVTEDPEVYPEFSESEKKYEFYQAEIKKANYLASVGVYLDKKSWDQKAQDKAGSVMKILKSAPNRLRNNVYSKSDPEQIRGIVQQEVDAALKEFHQ